MRSNTSYSRLVDHPSRWMRLAVTLAALGFCGLTSLRAQQVVFFSDSFTNGSLSQWTNIGGSTISNGQLQVPKSLDMIRAVSGTAAWTDYHFTANVTVDTAAIGLFFRSPDNADGYMWQLNVGTGQLRFHKKVGGTYTVLKQTAWPLVTGTAYAVEIDTSGTNFAISINGVPADSYGDATFSSGLIGFRTGATETASIGNVVVSTGSAAPPPVIAPGPPVGFQAVPEWNAGTPFASLQWTTGTGGTPSGLLLERQAAGTGSYERVCGLNGAAISFADSWIEPGTGYTYRLSAFNASGTSDYVYATIPAAQPVPAGFASWAQTQWTGTSGADLGTLWTGVGTDGLANALHYAFPGSAGAGSLPGSLSIARVSGSNALQVRSGGFTARTDTHYQLQGSPDLASWQTYLDETSSQFSMLGTGTSVALMSINPAAGGTPRFFRWSVSPNPLASLAPAGLLVDGLAGTSNAMVTQKNPVLSWEVGNDSQTAYEILVATSPSLLAAGLANVWSSGEVSGTTSLNIPFARAALQNNTTYYWTVRTWNSAGVASDFATAQSFTTGTLSAVYQTDPPHIVQVPTAPVTVVRKGAGWYFIDFGQDAFGTVTLNIPSPVDGQTVTLGMGEELSGTYTVDTTPLSGSYIRYEANSITMHSGTTSYTVTPTWTPLYSNYIPLPSYMSQVMPFRYVEITNVPEPFDGSQIRQLQTHVPFDDTQAVFTSSDPLVTGIFNMCKYSTKATAFMNIYVDGDRERRVDGGDNDIHLLNHVVLDHDYATGRYTNEYMLTNVTGGTDWAMHLIFMAWYDYLYTGDARSLAAFYTQLQARLVPGDFLSNGFFLGTTTTDASGDIVDWPNGERDGYDMVMPIKSVITALHYRSLIYMQQIATVLGKTSDAANYQVDAALTYNNFTALWDGTNNCYFDGMSASYVADSHHSLHGNIFPLALGLVPPGQQAAVINYIESRGIVCSVYGAQFLFDALYRYGQGNYALSLLDSTGLRSWHNMLSWGATMTHEAWDPSLKPNEDWNHAWGSAAANIIPRWLIGVRPLLPGFQKFVIQPQIGTLAYASITLPTIRGSVSVNVQNNTSSDFAMSVTIPANTSALVGLPSLSSTSTAVYMDGAPVAAAVAGNTLNPQWAATEVPAGVFTTGLITSGSTVWIDNVPPGPHLFERLP